MIAAEADVPELPGVALYHDSEEAFAAAYGAQQTALLVRPDGYVGWRGPSWRDPGPGHASEQNRKIGGAYAAIIVHLIFALSRGS